MQHRTPQPIQAGDDQGVAATQSSQDRIELRTGGFGAAGLVGVNIVGVDTGSRQGVDLMGRVLICARDV